MRMAASSKALGRRARRYIIIVSSFSFFFFPLLSLALSCSLSLSPPLCVVVDVSRTEKGSGRARRGGSRSTGQTTLCFARRCWSSSRRRPRTLPLPPPEAVPRRLCPPSPRLSIRMQAVRDNSLRVHGGCGIFLMGGSRRHTGPSAAAAAAGAARTAVAEQSFRRADRSRQSAPGTGATALEAS